MSGTIQVTAYEIGFKFLLKVPVSNRRGNPVAGVTTHSTHHLYYACVRLKVLLMHLP